MLVWLDLTANIYIIRGWSQKIVKANELIRTAVPTDLQAINSKITC
jgi:hypothetical protein